MARYAHPKKTVENIITTATALFLEKGYEQTSIQDILDALHLSKGGLYHHFESKEAILSAVMEHCSKEYQKQLHDIINSIEAENGKAKLKELLRYLATHAQRYGFEKTTAIEAKNPHFVVNGMRNCMEVDAPLISKFIEEGISDGSIQTSDPDLCAEVFLFLINYWINPIINPDDCDQIKRRLSYLKHMMDRIGFDILDDELMEDIWHAYQKNN